MTRIIRRTIKPWQVDKAVILVMLFIVATSLLVINNIGLYSPEARFIGEPSSQTAINIGIIVILLIAIVGIGMHYIVKVSEKAVKRIA